MIRKRRLIYEVLTMSVEEQEHDCEKPYWRTAITTKREIYN